MESAPPSHAFINQICLLPHGQMDAWSNTRIRYYAFADNDQLPVSKVVSLHSLHIAHVARKLVILCTWKYKPSVHILLPLEGAMTWSLKCMLEPWYLYQEFPERSQFTLRKGDLNFTAVTSQQNISHSCSWGNSAKQFQMCFNYLPSIIDTYTWLLCHQSNINSANTVDQDVWHAAKSFWEPAMLWRVTSFVHLLLAHHNIRPSRSVFMANGMDCEGLEIRKHFDDGQTMIILCCYWTDWSESAMIESICTCTVWLHAFLCQLLVIIKTLLSYWCAHHDK